MNPRPILASLAALALLAASGVPALASSEPESLEGPIAVDVVEGITWQLGAQAVDGELTDVPAGVTVTLRMDAGEAGGNGGCNQYFASYTRNGDELAFSGIGSTEMYCEGGSEVEAQYLANLAAVATAFSTGGSLIMQDTSGAPILSFIVSAPVVTLPSDGIEGIDWRLTGYLVGGDAMASVPDGVLVSLRMDGGQANGNGGCNLYNAAYTLDGVELSFGPLVSTLMLCEGPGGEVETVYFSALPLVASWVSDGGSLTFFDSEGVALLTYEAAPPASVVGSWVATGINNQREQAGVETDITGDVTAVFGSNGDLTGSDGCNDYSTTYVVDGESITIAPEIVTTRMACPSDRHAEQSAWYLAALGKASTWSVGPVGNLELRDADGALQVSYAPAT